MLALHSIETHGHHFWMLRDISFSLRKFNNFLIASRMYCWVDYWWLPSPACCTSDLNSYSNTKSIIYRHSQDFPEVVFENIYTCLVGIKQLRQLSDICAGELSFSLFDLQYWHHTTACNSLLWLHLWFAIDCNRYVCQLCRHLLLLYG